MSAKVRRKLQDKQPPIEEHEVYEAGANPHVVIRNKKRRTGTHRLIGPTDSGRPLTLPIRETEDIGVWSVATGWDSSKGERKIYDNVYRRRGR
jgi:hypothetical protein